MYIIEFTKALNISSIPSFGNWGSGKNMEDCLISCVQRGKHMHFQSGFHPLIKVSINNSRDRNLTETLRSSSGSSAKFCTWSVVILWYRIDTGKEQPSLKASGDHIDLCQFGLDRVNFLHSNKCGLIFWICAGNRLDNTGMF